MAHYGIDIWMTTTAIAQGFKVRQAGLGLKLHDAKDPAAALGPMFNQVVGELPQGEPEFDFAAAYNDAVWPAGQIMAAMVPLYSGRTAGLVLQARGMSAVEFEQQVVQAQADTFLALKPELVARWRS